MIDEVASNLNTINSIDLIFNTFESSIIIDEAIFIPDHAIQNADSRMGSMC